MQLANVGHAAGETNPGMQHITIVVLFAKNEAELRATHEHLKTRGVEHLPIIECDGDYAGQMMAIGCFIKRKKEIKKHLRHLPSEPP